MKEVELERVFLIKKLPEDLGKHKKILIRVGDVSGSNDADALKIKQKGDDFFLIKKEGKSKYCRTEHIITIKKEEFERIWKATARNHEKIRYLYPLGGNTCEIDFYQGILKGYARAEVEFKTEKEMQEFKAPDWLGQEITVFNHEIHKDLGEINFEEMKERYNLRGILLNKIEFS